MENIPKRKKQGLSSLYGDWGGRSMPKQDYPCWTFQTYKG